MSRRITATILGQGTYSKYIPYQDRLHKSEPNLKIGVCIHLLVFNTDSWAGRASLTGGTLEFGVSALARAAFT